MWSEKHFQTAKYDVLSWQLKDKICKLQNIMCSENNVQNVQRCLLNYWDRTHVEQEKRFCSWSVVQVAISVVMLAGWHFVVWSDMHHDNGPVSCSHSAHALLQVRLDSCKTLFSHKFWLQFFQFHFVTFTQIHCIMFHSFCVVVVLEGIVQQPWQLSLQTQLHANEAWAWGIYCKVQQHIALYSKALQTHMTCSAAAIHC